MELATFPLQVVLIIEARLGGGRRVVRSLLVCSSRVRMQRINHTKIHLLLSNVAIWRCRRSIESHDGTTTRNEKSSCRCFRAPPKRSRRESAQRTDRKASSFAGGRLLRKAIAKAKAKKGSTARNIPSMCVLVRTVVSNAEKYLRFKKAAQFIARHRDPNTSKGLPFDE